MRRGPDAARLSRGVIRCRGVSDLGKSRGGRHGIRPCRWDGGFPRPCGDTSVSAVGRRASLPACKAAVAIRVGQLGIDSGQNHAVIPLP